MQSNEKFFYFWKRYLGLCMTNSTLFSVQFYSVHVTQSQVRYRLFPENNKQFMMHLLPIDYSFITYLRYLFRNHDNHHFSVVYNNIKGESRCIVYVLVFTWVCASMWANQADSQTNTDRPTHADTETDKQTHTQTFIQTYIHKHTEINRYADRQTLLRQKDKLADISSYA